ncbi:MAG: HAMP domain-containing sensor histidine kinase [Planctomycetota bacterium]
MPRTSHSKNARESQRPRLVLLAVIGVLVPTAVLAALALRSLAEERELAAERTHRRLGAAARLVAQAAEECAAELAADQAELAANALLLEPQERAAALAALEAEHAMVLATFTLDAAGRIDVTGVPRQTIELPPRPPENLVEQVADQLLWLRTRADLPDRSQRYEALARATRDVTLRGEVWCELARECERCAQPDRALECWARVASEGAGAVSQQGFPLAALADVRSCEILLAQGERDVAAEMLVDLAGRLCFNPWHAEPSLLSFLIERCQELVEQCGHAGRTPVSDASSPAPARCSRWRASCRSSRPSWCPSCVPRSAAALPRVPVCRRAACRSWRSPAPRPATAAWPQSVAWSTAATWCARCSTRLSELADAHDARLEIRDRSGRALLASAAAVQHAPLAESVPLLGEIGILSVLSEPRDQESLASERRQTVILQAAVVLAMLFLLCGGALAVRSATRELELAQLQAEFVGCVSHELKTPITAIRLLGEMLEQGNVKREKIVPYGEVIARESRRLQGLIDNVLTFRQLEARGGHRFELDECDLRDVLSDAMQTLRPQIDRLGFIVRDATHDTALPVRADRDALSQVLINLIGNAIKYSADRKEIELRAAVVNGSVTVAVRDFGIGIPEPEQGRIFDKFYRASNGKAGKGTGLGLAIAREIAAAHGGEIQVKSAPGAGSEFTLRLPRCERKEQHG